MPSTKRKASAKKQQPITQHVLPLLKKPMEQIGKQINVPGSFWDGRMSTDERNTFYRVRFPLHFIVFKQVSSHIAHEANVEQYFSRAV